MTTRDSKTQNVQRQKINKGRNVFIWMMRDIKRQKSQTHCKETNNGEYKEQLQNLLNIFHLLFRNAKYQKIVKQIRNFEFKL